MLKVFLAVVLVGFFFIVLYFGGWLSKVPGPDPAQVVVASVDFSFPNGDVSLSPNELINALTNAGVKRWAEYSSEFESKARKAIEEGYKSAPYVTSLTIKEAKSSISFTDLENRLSAESPDQKRLRADRQYIDLIYEVVEVRSTRPRKDPVRLIPPAPGELAKIQKQLKQRIENFAKDAYNANNSAVFGDSGPYTYISSSLRRDNLDEILRALYLYDLAYISSHVNADPKDQDRLKETKLQLLNLAETTRSNANQRLGSNYHQGYVIWINLLLEHRRRQVGASSDYDQLKSGMLEIMKLTPVVETNTLGEYRLDGSVVTLAYYTILSLEADAGDSSPLRKLLTETGFTSSVLPKLTLWTEGLYHNTPLGSFPPEPKMKYAKGGEESEHLVGGKLLHHLAKSFLELRQDHTERARTNLDDLKRVLLELRTGKDGNTVWKKSFTYYDFCYVMRALTLAAKYEFERFGNENQCQEYLDWANELSNKQQLKATPDFSSESAGDVSIYYYHLAHTSLAREFSDLANDIERALNSIRK